MKIAAALLLPLGLLACAGPPPPPEVRAYVCENGSGFTRFVKATPRQAASSPAASRQAASADESSVVLLLDGKAHALARVPGDDGAVYADDQYEFWTRGRDARLTSKSPPVTTACREQ